MFNTFLEFEIVGNTGSNYLLAIIIFVALIVVLKIFQVVVLRRLKKAAKKTKTDLDDVLIKLVDKIKPPFYIFVALYIAIKLLMLSDFLSKLIDSLFIIVIAYQIIQALQKLIDYSVKKMLARSENDAESSNKQVVKSIGSIAKIILWAVAILIVLANLGINVTSLIAGLGIGGIAVALALQNVLGDVFSSFSIFVDKPFKVGDYIAIGEDRGIVEKIGIKTTRIKTLQGEELIVPNQELTNSRVHNFKKMERRRAAFNLGIVYDTSAEQLRKIPEIIKEIIDKEKVAEFNRCYFKEYGDFSLNFETVYYVTSPEYIDYINAQQSINLAIKERFEKEGIEFAYPTQTLLIQKDERSIS